MSVAEQISRIQQDRNRIRNKLNALGLANGTDNLDTLTEAIEGIQDNGSITAQVKEGETYTIPAGFHSGTGTVSGVKGGGNYTLQSKTVTPTKQHQVITPDEGSYGLSDVQVNPIPDAYQDVTSVTAGAENVLTGKVFVDKEGNIVAGTMPNNGSVNHQLGDTFAENPLEYTIPAGFHDGTGKVTVPFTTVRTFTPLKVAQEYSDSLVRVSVDPIPDKYQDVTEVTAGAADVLSGRKIVNTAGEVVTGTMANHGVYEMELNPTEHPQGWVDLAGYYAPGSKVGVQHQDLGTITPTREKILKETDYAHVYVEAIPDSLQDVTPVDAVASEVLSGKKIVDANGAVVTGTMANNGSVTATIDGITVTSVEVPAGYTTGGTISLTSDIETQLAAI